MHNLAVAYASGAAGKKNMAEAARWFAKAAAPGPVGFPVQSGGAV